MSDKVKACLTESFSDSLFIRYKKKERLNNKLNNKREYALYCITI